MKWSDFSPGKRKFFVVSLALVLAMGFAANSVFAQGNSGEAPGKKGPDGMTPAEEGVCDGLEGGLFGTCNAYCEATDCGDGVNYANFRACQVLQMKWGGGKPGEP